jgi:mono/diheme cytochrome c family protein
MLPKSSGLRRGALFLLPLLLGACLLAVRAADPQDDYDAMGGASMMVAPADDPVSRGGYLARAANCGACHTVPGGANLAGGLPFATPFGELYSTNITPDPETGIGRWSEEDFVRSMREGLRPNGDHLYPAFPYTAFSRIRDDDLKALYAYLRSVPPVRQANRENALAFPFSWRPLMAVWKLLFFSPGEFRPDPALDERENRGAYLVEAFGHCSACHSPRNLLGAEKSDVAMSGGEYLDRVTDTDYRPWSAPNLTGAERGLASWTEQELADYLGTARNVFLESFGPMNEVIMHSTRHLSRADVEAMAGYLKTLPAIEETPGEAPDAQVMGRGRTVYNLHCGTCHLPTGEGDPEMAPRLNRGSLVVQSANPASMINAILYAPKAPQPALPPRWREPMDEFQYLLDDEEVAAVATFIRNSWNNRAGVVTPEQVARQRVD